MTFIYGYKRESACQLVSSQSLCDILTAPLHLRNSQDHLTALLGAAYA